MFDFLKKKKVGDKKVSSTLGSKLPKDIRKRVLKDLEAGVITEEDVKRLEKEYLKMRKENALKQYRAMMKTKRSGSTVGKVFDKMGKIAENVNVEGVFGVGGSPSRSRSRRKKKRKKSDPLEGLI